MALLPRCLFNATTAGLADFSIGAAATGALTPAQAAAVSGVIYSYTAQSADQTQWEAGFGAYSSSATASVDSAHITQATNSFGSSVTLGFPATVQVGDMLVIIIGYGGNSGVAASTPSGWSSRLNQAPGAGTATPGIVVFDKVYALADGSSVVLNWTGGSAVIIASCVRVSSTATIAFDKAAIGTATVGGTSVSTPSLSSLGTASDLTFQGMASENGSSFTITFPGAFGSDYTNDSSNNAQLGYGHIVQSSTTSASYTFTTSASVTMQGFAVAYTVIGAATLQRTTIVASSNASAKVNFTNPPQIAISPIAGFDFGDQSPVPVTGTTYTVDSGSISGVPYDTDLICNNAAGVALTLPSAAAWPGRKITVRTIAAGAVTSASSNVVPAAGGAASTAILAATSGKSCLLQSDAANWQIQLSN